MVKFRIRKKVSTGRVIGKVVTTVLVLWVGSKILTAVLVSMNNTQTPFYQGLKFLGMGGTDSTETVTTNATTGGFAAGSILGVIALIAVASIVLEFVQVSF